MDLSILVSVGIVPNMNKHAYDSFVTWLSSADGYHGPQANGPLGWQTARTTASRVNRAERTLHLDYRHQFRGVSTLQVELDRMRAQQELFFIDSIGLNNIATALRCYATFVAQLPLPHQISIQT
jgi:hypothetical protein